ncbi:MAG: hypothetical protein RH949_06085 [Coleofasciculus sp. A1-SPW-01]|uniref:hypothetical protein n=1 Tax=Coleofasciculus TaxID=669368 RepID=UPI0005C5432E|nr:hypothetical protein [Coleofasciculus chthonoplastes]
MEPLNTNVRTFWAKAVEAAIAPQLFQQFQPAALHLGDSRQTTRAIAHRGFEGVPVGGGIALIGRDLYYNSGRGDRPPNL